ncbi:MAG: DNA polymerase III subunit epsilon [Pseudomonadales bacterium]|nr:DNA polymerase III subunit epsilon [Pseudomonadales bacterium]
MRQVVLDTETTGLDPAAGHRLIEIGAVELIDRKLTGKHFHQYVFPDRDIDPGAQEVHGISLDFLSDKPKFSEIAQDFLAFVRGAELVIHNAPFDIGFLNSELARLDPDPGPMNEHSTVLDTLLLARQKHPGQKNNLDALCRRYFVDNTQRTLHGALLDAEILADVFLLMTGGQTALFDAPGKDKPLTHSKGAKQAKLNTEGMSLVTVRANPSELAEHEAMLDVIDKMSTMGCLWRK